VFCVSLSLRSLDMAMCESLHIGTHAMWRLLNAVVLYLSTHAFIANLRRRP
jgi:hypothetical protein